ncbi:MAG: hypothetical protein NVS1B9_05110 [Solirubrobacteraceae bacterium]
MGLENPLHIAILLIIILVVFGAKRLPEMGRSLGEGMRGFKDSLSGDSSTSHTTLPPATQQPPPPGGEAVPAPTPPLTAEQQQPAAPTPDKH